MQDIVRHGSCPTKPNRTTGRRTLSDTEFEMQEVVRHGNSPTNSGVVRLGFVGQPPCRTTSVSDNFLHLNLTTPESVGELPCRTNSAFRFFFFTLAPLFISLCFPPAEPLCQIEPRSGVRSDSRGGASPGLEAVRGEQRAPGAARRGPRGRRAPHGGRLRRRRPGRQAQAPCPDAAVDATREESVSTRH